MSTGGTSTEGSFSSTAGTAGIATCRPQSANAAAQQHYALK